MLPERTEPAKRKALGEANRREQAAAENYRTALYEQAAAMREVYPGWVAEAAEVLNRRRQEIRAKVDDLLDEFVGLAAEQELQRSLQYFDGQAASWIYNPPRPERQGRSREKAEHRAKLGRKKASVAREPVALLAAVVQVAEEDR